MRNHFYTSCQAVAEKCKAIERITDVSNRLFYLAAKIQRNDNGEVEKVIPVEGYGMVICSEDEAFPIRNLLYNVCKRTKKEKYNQRRSPIPLQFKRLALSQREQLSKMTQTSVFLRRS